MENTKNKHEEKKTLTMEYVKSLMDRSYTLVWVDYMENFDNNHDLIQHALKNKAAKIYVQK